MTEKADKASTEETAVSSEVESSEDTTEVTTASESSAAVDSDSERGSVDEVVESVADTEEAAPKPAATSARRGLGSNRVKALSVGLVAVIAAGGGAWLVSDARAQRDAAISKNRSALEDLASARKAAEAYTTKAITIDFNRAPDYVKELAVGTTKTFGDTFATGPNGAGQLIIELQQQLRMEATGSVAYTLFDGDLGNPPSAGQPWSMVVIANQTSATAQQPERATQVMVLKVTVVQLDGEWKIANFGPDPKSMGASVAIPGVK